MKSQLDLISINDWLERRKLKPPSLIKIDVEGAKLEAIKGMLQTIRTFKPILLYEVDDNHLSLFQAKARKVRYLC